MARLSAKRRNQQHAATEEGGDELWIVSYADMVTLLFGFFVLLYSFSTLDDKKFDQMTEKMAEAFKYRDVKKTSESEGGISEEARQTRAFQMLVSMLNLGDSLNEAIPKIEKSYSSGKSLENAKKLLTEKTAKDNKDLVASVEKSSNDQFQMVELVLPASALFPSGGYQLSKNAAISLQDIALDLRNVNDLAEIEVIGHTDSQAPAPSAVYKGNFGLSALRAEAVASVLTQYGVDKKRLTVRGMGDQRPLVPEYDKSGKPSPANMAKNRRVGILLKLRRQHAPLAH